MRIINNVVAELHTILFLQRSTMEETLVIFVSKKFWFGQNCPYMRPPLHVRGCVVS